MDKVKPAAWVVRDDISDAIAGRWGGQLAPEEGCGRVPIYDQSAIDALQARIDALMFEYCPDEMTPEQVAEWEKNQKPAGDAP